MRQIWIPRIGPPEVLELREAPDPVPGPGEMRVAVHAAGVNFADILARMGLYPDAPRLPTVVGYEIAGVVEALGERVSEWQVGDQVLAVTRFGGYSDKVVVPAADAFPVSAKLTLHEAAAVPVNYLTAWLMLHHLGNVREGDVVLVHAAAGGVGQAATQLCLARGATVIGTASRAKHERLAESGVSHCIDYHTQDFERAVMSFTDGRGVDIALDAVGGTSFKKSYRCLAPLGRLYLFGVSSFAPGKRRSFLKAISGLLRMPRYRAVPLMNENRGVDYYQRDRSQIKEPPNTLLGTLSHLGPSMILSASIVGSGELIMTTTLGAQAGFAALWVIIH